MRVYIVWETHKGKSRMVCGSSRKGFIYYNLDFAIQFAKKYKEEHADYRVELRYYNLVPSGTMAFF